MEKIVEALTKLLPEEAVNEVTEAVKSELETAKGALEKEFSSKLEEAYAELSDELKTAEETAIQGYKEAYAIIQDLRGRLETQQKEFELSLEEGYEEAYQMLQAEKGKNENLEVEMYETFDKKLQEMKEYMIDKVDAFLQYKGKEIYESARTEIENDPRINEHKVTLERVAECVAESLLEHVGVEKDKKSDGIMVALAEGKSGSGLRLIADTRSQLKITSARNQSRNALVATTQSGRSIQSRRVLSSATKSEKRIQRSQRIGIASAGDARTSGSPRRLSMSSPALSAMRTKRALGNTAGEP